MLSLPQRDVLESKGYALQTMSRQIDFPGKLRHERALEIRSDDELD